MESITDLIFVIGVAWLTTHELDAVQRHEWRVLPITAFLPEKIAYAVFVGLHLPLFLLILWLMPERDFQIAFDLFLIVHVGLHVLFRKHPQYEFDNLFSNVLIVGAGVVGALHLVLVLMN